MSKCITCGHFHAETDGECFEYLRNRSCTCTPETYIPEDQKNPTFMNLAYHQKVLGQMKDMVQKIEWMLKAVPETRNMTDMEFLQTCWKYMINFDFGQVWDKEIFERISKEAQPETIRRSRQKVCNPELEQLRIFQEEIKELEKQGKSLGHKEYNDVMDRIKKFWQECKYIPNDLLLLKKKRIKESAIFEFSITEIDDIYKIINPNYQSVT